jgi:hypothetical protein
MMVMRRRGNIKKKYQPDPYKNIINTCLLFFFQPGYGSSLVANRKKALSRGSTLTTAKWKGQVVKKKAFPIGRYHMIGHSHRALSGVIDDRPL